MAGIFQGSPQMAFSTTSSTTQTPDWMQKAIYDQIVAATNTAAMPYEPYSLPTVAELSPLQQQAYQQVQTNQGSWQPGMAAAQVGTYGATTGTPTTAAGQSALASQSAALGNLSGQYTNPENTLQPYVNQAVSTGGATAASPYLAQAAKTSVSDIGSYLNPYNQNVTDEIAKLGARNLSENLLPAVSDQFIKAGQFGGTRMGEFGSRAVRDTQAAVLNEQARALQSGYGQALSTSQGDQARQAQLASTAGGLTQAQQNALLAGGQALSGAQLQGIGAAQAGASQYGQLGATQGSLASTDAARQLSALQQLANQSQQAQGMGYVDTGALEAAGQSQQAQMQAQLGAAQNQYAASQAYPKSQLDWLNTQIRGMQSSIPTTTTGSTSGSGQTYSASPLSQLAAGLYTYKGLTTP
jgi:hypothetical protein